MRMVLYAALVVISLSHALDAASSEMNTTAKDWHQEFADVCGHTQQAMTLSDNVLKDYVKRCEDLQERLGEFGAAEDSARRFYDKRLQMCMDFYKYIIEFKKQEK